MDTKNIVFALCFLIISGVSCLGQVQFDFTDDEHDFGVIEEGAKLTHNFEFINGGKDTIQLHEETRDVRPGCSCTASEYSKEAIPSGGKGFVKAGYDTQGRLGTFNKTITVSQKGTPYKILTIKGVVVKKEEAAVANPTKKFPALSIDKKAHDFGNIESGKNVTVKFTLKNSGKDTLRILSSTSACNCITYRLINIKDNSTLKNLAPGKSAPLEVTYLPYSPGGLSDKKTLDLLTLFTNDPKNSKIELSLRSEITDKK